MRKYSEDLVCEIRSKVNLFPSNKMLSEAIGLPEKCLSDLMYRHRIGRDGNNRGKTFTINHNAFSSYNYLSDYWAGFIASDGCITDDKTVQVNLQECDAEHLQKLLHFIGSNAKPRINNNCARISFTSSKIVSDLNVLYNITKRKSKIFDCKYFSKGFLLGYFDGDGSLTMYSESGMNVLKAGIIGSYSFIDRLSATLNEFTHSVSIRDSIKIIHFSHLNTLVFLTWLYHGSEYSLKRKKDLFQNIFNYMSQKRKLNYLKRIAETDTLADQANYSALLAGYIKSKSHE